jgi:hypothetical protein
MVWLSYLFFRHVPPWSDDRLSDRLPYTRTVFSFSRFRWIHLVRSWIVHQPRLTALQFPRLQIQCKHNRLQQLWQCIYIFFVLNMSYSGQVHFVSQADAVAANLTYVDSNGHAIITVDNTTNGAGDDSFGRDSVYLMSNQLVDIGSLLIFDANHIPYGVCLLSGFLHQLLMVYSVPCGQHFLPKVKTGQLKEKLTLSRMST